MPDLPSMSPFQFEHLPDGLVKLVGAPDVVLKVPEGQASVTFPEWERQLGLPIYQEEWEALARVSELSYRFVRFVLCDQSKTKHVGSWRFEPPKIRILPARYLFTLGHTGFVIGHCFTVTLHPNDSARALLDIPDFVEGDCLIGQAQLYDSPLADIAWRGLRKGIFSHACAVVIQEPADQEGAGTLAEVALVSEAEAACPGARILNAWEA